MSNRGIIAHPPGHEEQWTISVAHTEKDIETHLKTFEEVAGELAKLISQKSMTKLTNGKKSCQRIF